MAVSGSKNFTVTRTDIINAAMRKAGSYDAGDTPSAEESADAVLALNLMVKEWSVLGIDVPWRETVTLFLQPDTQSYTIGPSGSHATKTYRETTLSAAAVLGATTLSLTSTAGLTAADYIGIKLDDGTIHWTTIVVAATTSITTGLASAAASGNAVYSYTTKSNRPQKVVYAYRRDGSGHDTPVDLIGDIAYRGLSKKGAAGPVNQAFYQPTLTNGTLFVWPANSGGPDKLILICQPLVDDFDSSSNNPEFPIEWANAIVWNLASELAPEYGMPLKERMLLRSEAATKLNALLDYDVENASVIIGMER
jgi:hypothetical protein